MGRGLADLVNALFLLMPVPMVIGVLVFIAVLMLPGWLFAMRSKQIRGLIRRRVRATPEEADALARQAIALTGGKGPLLIALGREAIRMHQRDLWNMAREQLSTLHDYNAELQELEASISRSSQPLLHPVEVLMTVKRLTKLGMLDAALTRLEEALTRFPDDEDLRSARSRTVTALNERQQPAEEFLSYSKDV